jgi:hypothetical protein
MGPSISESLTTLATIIYFVRELVILSYPFIGSISVSNNVTIIKVGNFRPRWFKYFCHNRNILFAIAGAVPGMLDYMIWPWMERFHSYKMVAPETFDVPKERYNKLVNYFLISHEMYRSGQNIAQIAVLYVV